MLAPGRELPGESRRNALLLEGVGKLLACEQPTPVDPWTEVGGDGHVRRSGYDPLCEIAVASADFVQQEPKTGLSRDRRLIWQCRRVLHRDAGRLQVSPALCVEGGSGDEVSQLIERRREPFEGFPFESGSHIHRTAEGFDLGLGHEPRMVVLVTGERQTMPLDRISDEADRPIVALGFLESVEKQRQVVPAEIVHEPCKLMIRTPLDEPRNFALIADLVEEPFAPGLTALEGQRRIELVGAGVY